MILKYIVCCIGIVKLVLYKCLYWHRISINCKIVIYSSVSLQIGRNARIFLGKGVSIGRNCEINARRKATISIGNKSFFNSGCIITAHKMIKIGNNVEFGPNVLVYDHDHKFKDGYKATEFECSNIIIGNNVWIGAGSIILRGTTIGNNSIIAAGSIVKCEIPDNSIFIQKRITNIKVQ